MEQSGMNCRPNQQKSDYYYYYKTINAVYDLNLAIDLQYRN